ncbi:MAG TPA: Ig-like domain-containing protein [Kofleriaceae bacterium]|nr:Ig-like domain-containing protein [Kofleriaceae bacterium]
MKIRITACAALLLAASRPAAAAVYDWEIGPEEQFRIWIPDDQPIVYGVYVIWNESTGDTRDLVIRPLIQDWVRTFGFAIVGTRLPDPGYAGALLDALRAFADMSGHPEVASAPVLCEGLSLGGYAAVEFAATYPERTIGYLSGGARRLYEDTDHPGFVHVPGLIYQGDMDPDMEAALAAKSEVVGLRERGVQAAYFVQWGAGHERLYGDEIGWKYLADLVRLRYPEGEDPVAGPVPLLDIPDDIAWLADHLTWEDEITGIYPLGDFPGDAGSRSFWLPTRDAAFVYRAHATRSGPVSFVQPTAVVDWVIVEPGDAVPIEVSVGDLAGVSSVAVFDGSEPIAELGAPPYTTTWTAEGVGAHALVAVATLDDGGLRTGHIAPVLVTGTGLPGGGGLEDGARADAGPGVDGAGGGASEVPGEGGGCGCRAGTTGAGGRAAALLPVLLAVSWAYRQRQRARP